MQFDARHCRSRPGPQHRSTVAGRASRTGWRWSTGEAQGRYRLATTGLPPGCSGLQRAGRLAPRAPSPVLAAKTKRSARFLPSAHSADSAKSACSGSHWWHGAGGNLGASLSRRREYELSPFHLSAKPCHLHIKNTSHCILTSQSFSFSSLVLTLFAP